MGAKSKPLKVCLTNLGDSRETPWAEDLGPAAGPKGSRRVRLVNVPFLHAKPTWGDVIVVSPAADGMLTWDRKGVPYKDIATRIAEDGGRWAMIVEYVPTARGDVLRALAATCEAANVVCEGASSPERGKPGRAFLAVPDDLHDSDVLRALSAAKLPCSVEQIHPAPAAKSKNKSPRARPSSRARRTR